MLKARDLLVLLILPVILFVSASALRDVQGPFYLFFYDPSYVYLISSLNLSQLAGYGVAHFDHPGTTVQVIGAIAVKVYNLFSGTGISLSEDVLSRPESYLFIMNKVFVLINCIALYLLGLFVKRESGDLILGLLIQLSPFVSAEIFFGLIIVTPENFLIFVCLLYIGALWYYLLSDNSKKTGSPGYLLLLSLICSLGLATKISFFPLLIFPLIVIQGFRNKVLFSVVTILLFAVLILPGISNIEYFAGWLKDLALKSGKYGKGEATVVNSSDFVKNFIMILKTDKIFAMAFAATIAGLLSLIGRPRSVDSDDKKERAVMLSLFLIFLLQSLIVSKHYSQYYMIPAFMLSISAILISLKQISRRVKTFDRISISGFSKIAIGFIVFLWSMYMIISSYYEGREQRLDAEQMISTIEEHNRDAIFISSFGSSGRATALAFASQYGAGQSQNYRKLIASNVRSDIFYNQWTNEFYGLNGVAALSDSLSNNNRILLQLSHYGNLEDFKASLEKISGKKIISTELIFTNMKKETVYLMVLD